VRLRNLNLNGVNSGLIGIRITGGATITGGAVFIEDCLVDGNFSGAARGISEERSGGGKLFLSNTTVRNMGQTGIVIIPGGGTIAGQRIDAAFESVRVENSSFGVALLTTSGRQSIAQYSRETRRQALKRKARSRPWKSTSPIA
jgi:hypothetical protein